MDDSVRADVPNDARIWTGRWCPRKKGGGVRSRHFSHQYAAEACNEDARAGSAYERSSRAQPLKLAAAIGDFSVTCMHAPLEEKERIHVEPPREWVKDKKVVWKLRKALNGLRRASLLFHPKLSVWDSHG